MVEDEVGKLERDLAGFLGYGDKFGVYLGALGSYSHLKLGSVFLAKTSQTNAMEYLKFNMSKTICTSFLVKDTVHVVAHGGNLT